MTKYFIGHVNGGNSHAHANDKKCVVYKISPNL